MSGSFDVKTRHAVRMALAREAYARSEVRLADPDLNGYPWLVTSTNGVFAVGLDGAKLILHGWYFGIHRRGDAIFVFENCGMRAAHLDLGRVIRLRLTGTTLTQPEVLVTGLSKNCHQLDVIDDLLCVVDTTNQAILRFTCDGAPVDVKRPFPPADPGDRTGGYLHINSLAAVDDRIVLMCHNGMTVPSRPSDLAWLDRDWRLLTRQPLGGHGCHDIVVDPRGTLWHCHSPMGEVIGSDGTRVRVTTELMTRALAFTDDMLLVGMSSFGPRQSRHDLVGAATIFDLAWNRLALIPLDGGPKQAIAVEAN